MERTQKNSSEKAYSIKRRLFRLSGNTERYPNVAGVGMTGTGSDRFTILVYLYSEPDDWSKYRKVIAGIPLNYEITGDVIPYK